MNGDLPPSLHKGKPTLLFIELQMLEKHSIDPLEYFIGKGYSWQEPKGEALKVLLVAYHQLLAEEEVRIKEKMEQKNTENKE